MISKKTLMIVLVLLLLFPIVLGEEFKRVQQIDIPSCYGNIAFKIQAVEPFDNSTIRIEGCPSISYCPCSGEQQTVYFSVLQNVSNTFNINGEYYINPPIYYNSSPEQTYDPNEDYKRMLVYSDIKTVIEPTPATNTEDSGVSVSVTKIFFIVLIILGVFAIGILVLVKILKGGKEGEVKSKVLKQEGKQNSDTESVREYLRQLENERR